MAENELNSTALVPMPPPFQKMAGPHGRLPTPLADRNVLLDEFVQMKHEMKLLQLETRRIADDLQHRVSGVDARLQAGESNARTMDKRETDHFDVFQQQKRETDAKLKEVLDEMLRFRQETENDLRGLNQETRNEIRERDGHMQQLDGLARTLTARLKSVEEERSSLMDSVMTEMERRLKFLQDDGKRQQQQSLERLLVLERILQRETDERTRGDIEVRQELSQALLAIKAVSKQEETHRAGMERELRAELQDASKSLHEQARALHDNAQVAQQRVQDQLQEEKMLREEGGRALLRQMDAFARNYENERQRLAKTVHDAVTHMSERTASAQTISKRLQEESTEVKRLALRLQDEAAFGLKNLAEKMEEGLRSLRAAQDRQAAQMGDVKDDVHNALKEQREKTVAMEGRVQGEITRNLTEERAARESIVTRVRDCEELMRQMERKVWNKYTRLEETTTKAVDAIKKDGDGARAKLQAATSDLRSEFYDQRQRLQAVELQTDLKFSRALNELRAAHAKVEMSVDDSKARMADMRRVVDDAVAGQGQRLSAVESTLRDHIQQTIKDKEAAGYQNASIVIQHARVGRVAQDGAMLDALPGEQPTDLSFLDFRAEPPAIATQDPPLKRLEFKDLAPPARPISPEFVRKSPKKMGQPLPGDDPAAQAAEAEADATDGQDLAPGHGGEGEVGEDIVEDAGEESVGGGEGDEGLESMDAESPHGGEGESFHESYDGGLEDERAGDDEADRASDVDKREQAAAPADNGSRSGDAGGAPTTDGADMGDTEGLRVTGSGEEENHGAGEVGLEKSGQGGVEDDEDEEEDDSEEPPAQSEQERAHMETLEPDVRAVINKARMGRKTEFKDLIEADPTLLTRAVDGSGSNLLHIAATNGKKKIIKEVLRQLKSNPGAIDLYARNKKGKNVLDCALDYKFIEIATYLREKYPALADPPPSDVPAPPTDAAAEESAAGSEPGEGSSSAGRVAPTLESSGGGEKKEAEEEGAEPGDVGDDSRGAATPVSAGQAGQEQRAAASETAGAGPDAAGEGSARAVVEEEPAPHAAASDNPEGSTDTERAPVDGTLRDAEATDEEIRRLEQELEAKRSRMSSLDEVTAGEQSAPLQLEESVAHLSLSSQITAPDAAATEPAGSASEAGGGELNEPVQELSVSGQQQQEGGAAGVDDAVSDLPVTPRKDGTAAEQEANTAGDGAIEEDVTVDSPEPPPINMTASGH